MAILAGTLTHLIIMMDPAPRCLVFEITSAHYLLLGMECKYHMLRNTPNRNRPLFTIDETREV